MKLKEKIHSIAEQLGELNSKGQVKSFNGNENGYAKIFQIYKGCSIWVHYFKNEKLVLDLMVSRAAKEKKPKVCSDSVKIFKEYFGALIMEYPWAHSINTDQEYDVYGVDVSNLPVNAIHEHAENLKRKFA